MGLTSSKENQEQERQNREKIYVRNAKQLVGGDEDYYATTLNIDDLNTEQPNKVKPVLPKINNINGGSIGFESRRNRYDQFNVFDIINKYEKEMKGGDPNATQESVVQEPVKEVQEEVIDVTANQTSDEALDKVRNAILERLNDLGKNLGPEMNKVGGGSCGCENRGVSQFKTGGSTNLLATGPQTKLYQDASDSSSTTSTSSASTSSSNTSSSEVGRMRKTKKSKSTKTTKRSTKFDIEDSSDSFILNTSETGTESEPELKPRGRRTKRVVYDTSNGDSSSSSQTSNSNSSSNSSDDSEEGLSIFPFNSSDVASSVSSQNFKTLRRRV